MAFVAAARVDLSRAAPSELVGLMVDWYATERVDDADLESDGDMLLFQWGTYDWGDGLSFQYDITRQLIYQSDPDDDGAIWQLSVTAHYPATLGRTAASGNHWCRSPDDLAAFLEIVEDSVATELVGNQPPSRVEVRFEQAD
jgi:hypothetical protein